MKRWKVQYQKTPFHYTSPAVLIVEADTAESAWVAVYAHLTEHGATVYTNSPTLNGQPQLDMERIMAEYGIKFSYGETHIGMPEAYEVRAHGRVLGGL